MLPINTAGLTAAEARAHVRTLCPRRGRLAPSPRTTLASACLGGWMAMAMALTQPARADEPPLPPALACSVQTQQMSDSLQLIVRLDNQGDAPIDLPPGPHLVHYQDAEATRAMLITARLERLPNTALRLAAHSQAEVLLVLGGARLAEFRCNAGPPAAAGLNFYRFSQWPQFRCLLRGYQPAILTPRQDCADGQAQPTGTR